MGKRLLNNSHGKPVVHVRDFTRNSCRLHINLGYSQVLLKYFSLRNPRLPCVVKALGKLMCRFVHVVCNVTRILGAGRLSSSNCRLLAGSTTPRVPVIYYTSLLTYTGNPRNLDANVYGLYARVHIQVAVATTTHSSKGTRAVSKIRG